MTIELFGREIPLIILSKVVDDGTIARCERLESQIITVMVNQAEHPLIKNNFHLIASGSSYYLEGLMDKLSDEISWGIYLEKIGHNGDTLIYPTLNEDRIKNSMRGMLGILDEDYEFLRQLGAEIKVKERYKRVESKSK